MKEPRLVQDYEDIPALRPKRVAMLAKVREEEA
jgi:hypothetical protein